MNQVVERQPSAAQLVRKGVEALEPQFKMALPPHIPVERFMRVVMTAVQSNRYLLNADRQSLFGAAMKAAQDGLLPDGRDGALVPYGSEVTWIPMIGGLRKKVRNSGEIATWDVHAVYENDQFDFAFGDDPHIAHKPALDDRGKLIAVYSIATLKTGEKTREVMGVKEVEAIRNRSAAFKLFKAGKIKSTPWDSDFDEMAKKTVARRHSKVLPMSTDLDDLIRRDDELYNYEGASDRMSVEPASRTLAERMEALAGAPPAAPGEPEHDPSTGEIIADGATESDGAEPQAEAKAGSADATITPEVTEKPAGEADGGAVPPDPYFAAGAAAASKNMSRKAMPGELRGDDRSGDRERWLAGFNCVRPQG